MRRRIITPSQGMVRILRVLRPPREWLGHWWAIAASYFTLLILSCSISTVVHPFATIAP